MIPLRCLNNPSINNGSNHSFVAKKGKHKQSKNINLSNLLVCDDATLIERLSLNSALHSTQRNSKTSKGTSRKKAFSKGERFKILNQQLYTDQDFGSTNNKTMGDESTYHQQFDINERCMTSEMRSSKNYNRPVSQEIQRFHHRNEDGTFLNKNYNNIPTPMMNSFVNTTPSNKDRHQNIPMVSDKENLDSLQKLQLFIKPSYIKQRDYLSIDVRSRKQSIGDADKSIKTQGDNTLTLHQTEQAEDNYDRYHNRRTSNSCMGKYTIDIPQNQSIANSQTINFQERGIRSITPSILSTSTHAATLTLNKSFSKGKKSLNSSKNGSLLNQSSYKKKLKILSKKEDKSPKPHEVMPFSVSNSYSRNVPLRLSKNPDLKVISILGAYDQLNLGNFIFNKKQFKQYLKTLNFKTPQEEQQMIKYMFIYFKQWQKKINTNIDMIKIQLFSIKVEDLEEESVDIQKYIRKKANQAKRIKKCISILLNYTKSKRDARKLKQINQKCSEYDSLLKTINVIHTLKLRVEGYLINKIQKESPLKTREPTNQQYVSEMGRSNLHTSQQGQRDDNRIKNTQSAHSSRNQVNDYLQQQHINYKREVQTSQQQKRNSSFSSHIFTASNNDQDPSRAQSRRINMDLSDDDFEISQSRVNSEGINLYDKKRSQEYLLSQQLLQGQNQLKVTPENNVTPIRSLKEKDESEFYKLSQNLQQQQNPNNKQLSEDSEDTHPINFQKDVVNIKNLKPISINNEEDQQKNTINQASVDNMIKNGSVNTNYQGSFMAFNNSSDKQTPKQFQNKLSLNSQIQEVGESDNTPKKKDPSVIMNTYNTKKQKKPQLKFESLEKVIKETIAEQSMSVKHKNIFQNYIDSIKIPLEDLQKQGEDAQHIFGIFNDLMGSFEEKIQDHARNCTDLNKLIDETVKLGSELMKLSQSKALPLTVTNRAVVYLQEAQQRYREVQGKVKDSLKELVSHMWELIEEGIHLNSNDIQYEEIFKFMADIRDSVKQSQVNDYQNKEKLQIIDEVALSLNELYKISFNIQGMVARKQLIFVDSPSFSIIKDIKTRCHEFKVIYRNMMDRLAQLGDELLQNINRQSISSTINQRKSVNQSIQAVSTILAEREQTRAEKRDENGQLIGYSLIERQCEEIEDLFEINRWFVSNSQDIDNLIIFEDPSKIPETYPANEEGKRRFISEASIGVGVLLQLRENAEDVIDISGSQNLTNIIKSVRLASEKYQKIADIAIAAAELCNLSNFISPSQQMGDMSIDKNDSIDSMTHIYEILDKLQVQNSQLLVNNEWFAKFVHRLINGTLYFDFIAGDYPILCENMHSILSEYSSRSKYSIPSTESFYKRKALVEAKLEVIRKRNHLCENSIAPAILYKLSFLEQRIAFAVNLFGSNNFVLPNGSLLCKILEAFFERIVHAKPFAKLSEQFEKLRVFMLKGIDIICKEKDVLCSKRNTNNSTSSASFSVESEDDQLQNGSKQRKRKNSSSYYYPQNRNSETEPSSKSTNATAGGIINMNSAIPATAQSGIKTPNRSHTPTSSGFKKVPVLKELRFEQEEGSISTQGKNSSTDHMDRFTGRVHYYDNILEEAENLCKHCSLFIPSREDENTQSKQEGEYVQNFSIHVYEDFMQLCSRYLLAKRDKVNIYSNLQLRVKWIAPYNEEYSIFQQKYAFIQKYILPQETNSSQEIIIEYTKHINQVFHKNGPIFYKYDFQTFQSYLQLFIDAPASNFHVMICLEQDPSCVLYSGTLENQKINTLLPINDVYSNVKMTLVCKDFNQQSDSNTLLLRSARSSMDRGRMDSVIEDELDQQKQTQYSQNLNQSSSIKKQQSKQEHQNSNIVVSLNKEEKPFLRHRSQQIFLMRAQKVTQLRISNLNFNLKDEELFKIFYRQTHIQQQDKSAILFSKKPMIEVYAIINESQVVFRRKNISQDRNIFLTQNSHTIQEWTILQGYQKTLPQSTTKVIDFYVKINHVEEGAFYIYDKNNYYSIKSFLLLKQDAVLDEAGIVNKDENKETIIQNVNKLLGEKYWHAFSITGNDEFVERSRLTSMPHILKNLQ